MYLSRLILDPRNRAVRRDLADCQAMHRTLLRAFPPIEGGPAAARSHYGVLYRIETVRSTGMIRVYVQSAIEPDWSRLPDGYLAPVPDNPAWKPVDRLYERLTQGTVLSFSVKASPTRTVGTSLKSERLAGQKRRNGRRVFISSEQEQLAWLQRKGEQYGFRLVEATISAGMPDVQVSGEELIVGRRASAAGGDNDGDPSRVIKNKLVFKAVTFRGRLVITDRDKFLTGLAKGLGSGKAYGLGLLSVAPVR